MSLKELQEELLSRFSNRGIVVDPYNHRHLCIDIHTTNITKAEILAVLALFPHLRQSSGFDEGEFNMTDLPPRHRHPHGVNDPNLVEM